MTGKHEPLWTIADLGAQVALALAVDYQGPPNGRVRGVPDQRTIRYYTTLGLLDRPAEMRGRTALYGPKHLLQLVAIKRLQARGLSLVEIQQQLVGLPERKLRTIARLPDHAEPLYVDTRPKAEPPAARRDRRDNAFWSMTPAAVREDVPNEAEEGREGPADTSAAAGLPLQGIGLAAGVTLLLAGRRPLYEDDISALRTAAAPLLKLLHKRRLV
jgi:DNA-binding transcriptional MerR regulator